MNDNNYFEGYHSAPGRATTHFFSGRRTAEMSQEYLNDIRRSSAVPSVFEPETPVVFEIEGNRATAPDGQEIWFKAKW